MKKITKEYNLYTYNELSKEAKEKALKKHIEDNDYYFLSDYLNERLHELLEENKIQDINDTSKPNTKPTQVLYSLSYCQGDGCCFEGNFIWNGYNVSIKHSGYYYHSKMVNISMFEIENDCRPEPVNSKDEKEFEELYQSICEQLEKDGYSFIDYENSEESFIEMCDANEYTFLENGTMFNE